MLKSECIWTLPLPVALLPLQQRQLLLLVLLIILPQQKLLLILVLISWPLTRRRSNTLPIHGIDTNWDLFFHSELYENEQCARKTVHCFKMLSIQDYRMREWSSVVGIRFRDMHIVPFEIDQISVRLTGLKTEARGHGRPTIDTIDIETRLS